jgi:hypothetical protein
MDHGTVRIVLENVISLPPNVNLPDFDEAIRWMEQGHHAAAQQESDRGLSSSQFVAAAIEMRVLRRLPAPWGFRRS